MGRGQQENRETWSVVIPALCEAENIEATLRSVLDCDHPPCEVLVVDGGSDDGTPKIARRAGAKVISAPRGRGRQLNAGWQRAKGDWVLFLHADSLLPRGYSTLVEEQLARRRERQQRRRVSSPHNQQQHQDQQQQQPWWRWPPLWRAKNGSSSSSGSSSIGEGNGGCGGCGVSTGGSVSTGGCGEDPSWGSFSTIAASEINPVLAGILRAGVGARTRLLQLPYGDQAIFVRRQCLQEIGGFKEWPLLEDLDLVKRLRARAGPPLIVPAPVSTSGRRWARLGFWRTFLTNQAVLAGWAAGVDVGRLAEMYGGGGSSGGSGSSSGTSAGGQKR